MKPKRLIPLSVAVNLAHGRRVSNSTLYIRKQIVKGREGYIELPVLPRVHHNLMESFVDPDHFKELFPEAVCRPEDRHKVLPNCTLSPAGLKLLERGVDAARAQYPGVWDKQPLTLFTVLREARNTPELWHLLELNTHG
jgi:hypothetical protein